MNTFKSILTALLFAALFLLLLWVVNERWKNWPSELQAVNDLPKIEQKGQYGDSFGALNTLFTGLAFAAVAFSILLQIIESVARGRERHKDNFEQRLFYLIERYTSHCRAFDVRKYVTADIVAQGKDCFEKWMELIEKYAGRTSHEPSQLLKRDMNAYELCYNRFEDDLGSYFRLLYHAVRFVDSASIARKQDYTDIIRAGLSASEIKILAFNGLTENGTKFKPLIERYHLLKHLPTDFRQKYSHVLDQYARSALSD